MQAHVFAEGQAVKVVRDMGQISLPLLTGRVGIIIQIDTPGGTPMYTAQFPDGTDFPFYADELESEN